MYVVKPQLGWGMFIVYCVNPQTLRAARSVTEFLLNKVDSEQRLFGMTF